MKNRPDGDGRRGGPQPEDGVDGVRLPELEARLHRRPLQRRLQHRKPGVDVGRRFRRFERRRSSVTDLILSVYSLISLAKWSPDGVLTPPKPFLPVYLKIRVYFVRQ